MAVAAWFLLVLLGACIVGINAFGITAVGTAFFPNFLFFGGGVGRNGTGTLAASLFGLLIVTFLWAFFTCFRSSLLFRFT